jgi:hypothetical protein
VHAARRRVEATDAVIEAGWIDERVLVRALLLDAAIVVGNSVAAHRAHESMSVILDPVIDRLR